MCRAERGERPPYGRRWGRRVLEAEPAQREPSLLGVMDAAGDQPAGLSPRVVALGLGVAHQHELSHAAMLLCPARLRGGAVESLLRLDRDHQVALDGGVDPVGRPLPRAALADGEACVGEQ